MNKYILITGASRGIGRAIAKTFAKNGHNLVIVSQIYLNELEETKTMCQDYQVDVVAKQCNVADFQSITALYNELHNSNILITSVINNAGIDYFGLTQDMDVTQWSNIIDTNLSSMFYVSKTFLSDMLSNQAGSIINISSVWGNVGASCEVAYSASKGGVNSFTKALAKELAPSHIAVNALACGAVDTQMNARLNKEEIKALEDEIPYGRMATTKEIAEIAYNLYKCPSYLTGQIITADGGWT